MNLLKVKDILLKCIIIGFGVLIYTMVMILFFGDFAFSIHHMMFDITREQFNVMIYAFMGVFKVLWLMMFVMPYLAIIWSEKKGE